MNDYLYQTWSNGEELAQTAYTWDYDLHDYIASVNINALEALLVRAGFRLQTQEVE